MCGNSKVSDAMNVKEVIANLKNHNPDAQVVVRGYESGVNAVLKVESVDIIPNSGQDNWFNGEYEIVSDNKEQEKSVPAVELVGENTKQNDL